MLGFKEKEMSHVCVTRAAVLELAHRPQQQVSPSLSLSIWKVGPSVGFGELLRASVGWCAVKCPTLEHPIDNGTQVWEEAQGQSARLASQIQGFYHLTLQN